MAVKCFILTLALFFLVEMTTASVTHRKRDTHMPSAEEAGKAINDLIEGFKTNADALLKNIRESDAYKDFSESLAKFGNAVQSESSKLIEKVKNTTQN